MELAVRCFIESNLKSKEKGIDDFDQKRILESAFNRLFLAMEHLTNSIMLKEKGNYSKRHFGDFKKLDEFKEKYDIDLATSYQTTYSFRSYADYRKFPEIESKFDKNHLDEQISRVKSLIDSCFRLFKEKEFDGLVNLLKGKINQI